MYTQPNGGNYPKRNALLQKRRTKQTKQKMMDKQEEKMKKENNLLGEWRSGRSVAL